jgi:hypothetical protein
MLAPPTPPSTWTSPASSPVGTPQPF